MVRLHSVKATEQPLRNDPQKNVRWKQPCRRTSSARPN